MTENSIEILYVNLCNNFNDKSIFKTEMSPFLTCDLQSEGREGGREGAAWS